MKLSKFDIGAEIIAILTKGMYQDPRDALREYIQNAVDADSKNINLKIRQNNITVIDDGTGMDYQTMRKALRIGISDKKPGDDIGFMGIGIYSSYHLCDSLTIYSKINADSPHKLFMDFKAMKDVLTEQKEKRINNQLSGDELIDLQTLLEKYIYLEELDKSDFPTKGTRIEMHQIEQNFSKELQDFDLVASYLRDTIPLHFDKSNFMWGEEIENKIQEICDTHNSKFDLVNLKLQVNSRQEDLYKPYKNSDFHNNTPQKPDFQEIKDEDGFIGVAWGCLNPTRNKIKDKSLRGFLIRKQGFAIGRRENVVKYFNSHTHFDRYVGEIVVTNKELLPNASRDDFEFTNIRIRFYNILTTIGSYYTQISNEFQNSSKAIEDIENIAAKVKEINMEFSRYENNTTKLLEYIVTLNEKLRITNSVVDRKVLEKDLKYKEEVKLIKNSIEMLLDDITDRIGSIKKTQEEEKKQNYIEKKIEHTKEIAKDLSFANIVQKEKEYNSLIELLQDLDIELGSDNETIYNLLDEKFIERASTTKVHYYNLITELKNDILNIMDNK
ncbi:MAG: hypothetical protein DRG78_06385 [Epsilonproteobacteria bacterium]|nr:MAG: hypothetical protein DRG78_06385 [Campylobacterota bacterium]